MANPPQSSPFYPDASLDSINILSWGKSYADWTDAVNHAVRQITNAAINPQQEGTIYFPSRAYTLRTNCTIPEGVNIVLEHGARLNVASGKTLTIEGPYRGPGTFGGDGSVVLKNLTEIDVRDFGVKTNDSNDYVSELSKVYATANAISVGSGSTAKGVTVKLPVGVINISPLTTAPGSLVKTMGAGGIVWSTTNPSSSILRAVSTSAAMIDLGSSDSQVSFENVGFVGTQTSTSFASLNHHGIKAASTSLFWMRGCNFDGWGGSAIRIEAGIGKWIEYVQTTRCLMAYNDLTGYAGGVQLAGSGPYVSAGTENNLYECNFNGPGFTPSTHGAVGSGYAAALYVNGAPNTWVKVVGAFAQTGIILGPNIGTSPGAFFYCRAEFNQGHGWINHSNHNTFHACTAYDNNLNSTTPEYSGFYTVQMTDPPDNPRFTGNTHFTDCVVRGVTSGYAVLYGFTDNCALGAAPFNAANTYNAGCRASVGAGGRTFNITGTQVPIIDQQAFTQSLTGSTATTTFDGEAGNIWRMSAANATNTEITATNLLPGQEYTLYIIQHASAPTITLNGTVFAKTVGFTSPAASKHLSCKFRCDGTSLYQVGLWSGDM